MLTVSRGGEPLNILKDFLIANKDKVIRMILEEYGEGNSASWIAVTVMKTAKQKKDRRKSRRKSRRKAEGKAALTTIKGGFLNRSEKNIIREGYGQAYPGLRQRIACPQQKNFLTKLCL